MDTACTRSAHELASTIDGEAWYGASLREMLTDVTAERAGAHPIPGAHSIWELVLHLDAWITFFAAAVDGVPIPPWRSMPVESDWPRVGGGDERAWQSCLDSFFEHHAAFAAKVTRFGDDRLESTVPGRSYTFHRMFQSASLHAAYHAGQIALLKKLIE